MIDDHAMLTESGLGAAPAIVLELVAARRARLDDAIPIGLHPTATLMLQRQRRCSRFSAKVLAGEPL